VKEAKRKRKRLHFFLVVLIDFLFDNTTVYHIRPEGWVKISADDSNDLHKRYYPEFLQPFKPIEQ
jgi:hypothetical protein